MREISFCPTQPALSPAGLCSRCRPNCHVPSGSLLVAPTSSASSQPWTWLNSHCFLQRLEEQLLPLRWTRLETGSHHKCSNSKHQRRHAAACPATSGKRTERVNPLALQSPVNPPRGGPAQTHLLPGAALGSSLGRANPACQRQAQWKEAELGVGVRTRSSSLNLN